MLARNPLVRRREGREQHIEHIAGTVADEQQTREENPRVDAALAVARMDAPVDAGALGRGADQPEQKGGRRGDRTNTVKRSA
jgi:hypothetical protein